MTSYQKVEEHVQEHKAFVLANLENYDFLSKDDMYLEKGVMSSVMKNMDENGVHHEKYNPTLISNSNLTKGSALSVRMRDCGNRIFIRKSHNDFIHWNAYAYYTQSIATAPSDSEELALGYSNRAALLIHLKKYKECLVDCERAISIAKSDQSRVKLLFRKTEALIGLKDYIKANDVLSEANCLLDKTPLDPRLDLVFKQKSEIFSNLLDNTELLIKLKRHKKNLELYERALDSAESDQVRIRILFQITKALIGLNKFNEAKDTLSEINDLLEIIPLDPSLESFFKHKIEWYSKMMKKKSIEENKAVEEIRLADELPSFVPNIEAPSASEAVAIKYNEEWGRHIVATRCIKAGEVLVKEKSYFSFVDPSQKWFFCTFCTKPSWNLIPCEGCVFNVYCSDKCRLEANEKYHKFECPILSYVCEKDDDSKILFCHLRFLLTAAHNAGGLEQLKQEQIAAQSSTDPRKKGFMEDDIFHSHELRSCLSLMTKIKTDYSEQLASGVCYVVYHLATKTDFFGKKYDITPVQMISEPYMLFFAGLMTRQLFSYNSLKLKYYHPKGIACPMGISLYPFASLFNNSCNSNTDLIFTKDNEIIVYANQSIEKESQVFISYYQRDILLVPKNKRNSDYQNFMKFTCKCTLCIENWSHICLPLLRDLLESAPDTLLSIEMMIINVEYQMAQDFIYNQDLINEVTNIMKVIAEEATVNCAEYRKLEKILKKILIQPFGKEPLIFPDSC